MFTFTPLYALPTTRHVCFCGYLVKITVNSIKIVSKTKSITLKNDRYTYLDFERKRNGVSGVNSHIILLT